MILEFVFNLSLLVFYLEWKDENQPLYFLYVTILVPGDEVLQWNGKSLPGATKKEVYNIILESKAAPQVEIVVSRPIG